VPGSLVGQNRQDLVQPLHLPLGHFADLLVLLAIGMH
jgi:hypothetical protein